MTSTSTKHSEPSIVPSVISILIVAVPVVLAYLVVDTLRAADRMGGLPPFTPTSRAYSA